MTEGKLATWQHGEPTRPPFPGSYVGRETAWAENLGGAAEFETLEAAVRKALDYVGEDVVVVLRDVELKRGTRRAGT